MNGPENTAEGIGVVRVFFELDQFPIKQIEVFITLDEELANDVIAHSKKTFSRLRREPDSGEGSRIKGMTEIAGRMRTRRNGFPLAQSEPSELISES
jgi:hypothetical protein